MHRGLLRMDEFGVVLLFALIPAVGNIGGGLFAELVAVSERNLSLALHGAAGVVLAVVAIELMPKALAIEQAWIALVALFAGAVAFLALDSVIHLVQARVRPSATTGEASVWTIYFGVGIDLFIDGILIGTGSTIALSLGLLLAIAQVPADIPEGFATIAGFRSRGLPKRTRLLLAFSSVIPILFGATIGYWAVRGRSEVAQFALLTFAAGMLMTLVVEEMVPEAHREETEARFASLIFMAGFVLFAAISVYLE